MRLVSPELLAELCGLSPGVVLLAAAVGLALWLFGWWSHRFWVVLIATVSAGVYGLFEAPILKAQPLITSLLLALAAGLLALALVRVFAFFAGGLLGMGLVDALAPQLDQPLIAFLICGLLGLILFRWCVSAVTSLAGSIIIVHAAVVFFHQRGSIEASTYAENSNAILTSGVGLMTVAGVTFQLWLERRRKRDKEDEEKPAKKKSKDKEKDGGDELPSLFSKLTKKAG